MTTRELYSKGARVWIPHSEKVWEGAKVTEDYTDSLIKLITDEGETKEIKIKSDEDLPPLRNPDILIGENDLTSLSYLHEPAVLYNLQVRFSRFQAIYTYCGIVLVAINPYQDISIYGPDTIWAYRNRAMGDLDPHIFAVAEEAYTKMEREESDQSIIVSGESGAGKTVSAKYAMRYFATVGGSATETQVERKVLASSPIMEAIGNAKTIRNDNSSRFGKYIELQFSRHYRIVGASMRTYLLEKSRVVFQSEGERNYHVFYQMCAARESLPHLALEEASQYNYLCDPENTIPGVDDGKSYEETVSALVTLGFSQSDVSDIFAVLASVLHLGNVAFESQGDESSAIKSNDPHLMTFGSLLGINPDELRPYLCHRKITSARETFNKPMSPKEAAGARDALAKHIYAQLFAWIVEMVNKALNTSSESKNRFIGVLDIYGFETFDVNSFEQFCINYANEKLQQQFNLHVFKLEQDEYLKEGIEWKFIDFYDNQPCIDLIESKLGILDLLDEECRMPKGSDSSWAEKLYSKCGQKSHFVKPRFGTNSFIVKHFADMVEYEVSGFLEKNRDTVIEEQVIVLKGSTNRLVRRLFSESGTTETDGKLAVPKPRTRISVQPKAQPPSQPTSRNKKTVGSQFRDSLNALMSTLNKTTPHYIRCIKPNDEKAPFKYNPRRAVQQLRACGVLETIRISAAGFPSRWMYFEFFMRYRVLFHSKDIDRSNIRTTCETILNRIIQDNDKYKFGKTKIFFRAGQVAYLERLRSDKLLEVVIRIQKSVRGFLVRRRYTRTLKATNTLQRYLRGFLARRRAEGIRRNKAATKIQAQVRGYLARSKYLRLRKTALGLQTRGRGLLARRKYLQMKRNKAAIIIQRNVRGWLARKKCAKLKKDIILIQATVRRHLARKRYKLMKREAKSAEHLKKLNKGLENKIISLQQKVGELSKELKSVLAENGDLKSKAENVRAMEKELRSVTENLLNKKRELEKLHSDWEESTRLLKEKEKEAEALRLREKNLETVNTRLEAEVASLRQDLDQLKRDQQDSMRSELSEELKRVEEERAHERSRYQKLLAERDFLEAKLESAERKNHKRSSSDVSTISAQDEDVGYASVRSTGSSVRDETSTPDYHADLGLVLKYQQKLRELEVENCRLRMKVDTPKSFTPPSQNDTAPLVIQELEMENAKLRNDLTVLKECIAADAIDGKSKRAIEEMTREWRESEREVHRLRDENTALRRIFSGTTRSTKSLAESSYSSLTDFDSSMINEDGELVLAFEAQKQILRQLEDELQTKSRQWEAERELLLKELDKVRGELERERAAASASGAPAAYFEEHVTRLCSENLELQEKLDQQSAKARRLTHELAELKKRLPDATGDENNTKALMKSDKSLSTVKVIKKEREEYLGMFEIKKEDINVMLKHLFELKPRVAITLLPGLPAYILFMCVRYTDYVDNEEMVKLILVGYSRKLMKLMKRRVTDVEFGVLWLSNTLKLIHNLKQYSGAPLFAKENTQTQNEQCLKNFDLSDIRMILNDTAVSVCLSVMRTMEEKIQPLAVPAILEHEAIPGLGSSGPRARSGSTASSLPTVRKAMTDLQSTLTLFHRTLTLHAVDPEIFALFFRQLFYCLCANALNNLLLRRDYCHWTKGMQIRFNLSHLEQWARENKIQDPRVLGVLAPIIQASQLLQARKTDEDVVPVAEMCSALSISQIIKLLHLYTGDGVEERVSESFIQKVQKYLLETRSSNDNTLMMDVHYTFPLEFPFNPSNIRLEDVDIPEILNLPMLRKL